MDASPIKQLLDSATKAHQAVTASQEAARQVAAQAAATPPRAPEQQGQAGSAQ